jgi:thiamine transport system substrate-binding protein
LKRLFASLTFAALAFTCPALAATPLTIYTYDSFVSEYGPGAKIKAAFEKTCDCTVNYVTAGDGVALLNKLKLEGAATKADVVLGFDSNLTTEALLTGRFGFSNVDTSKAKVPNGWNDKYFVPFDWGHFAVIYDSEKMKNPPKSLDELVNGDPTQKIILEDPRTSTPGLGFMLWMKSVYGPKAGEAWAKLKPRILTTAPSWDAAYGLFTKGEAPMVLSYTTSPAYHMEVEKTDRYQAAEFSEGHYAQVEVAGVIASATQQELGRKFLAFMLTPEFQDEIPTTNWMMPAGETKVALPASFAKLVQPSKTFLYSGENVHASLKPWLDEWLAAVGE